MNTQAEQTPKEILTAAIERHGLSIKSEFVPFSQSRNKAEKSPSLNWRVTLLRKEREILTTDYSAGCGHTAAYKASTKELGSANCILRNNAIRQECDTGRKYAGSYTQGAKCEPDTADVIYSLLLDSDVLDSPSFEDWASDFGYETDSRKAEAIYRSCLEIALKLRAGLGDTVLADLREAAQDY